MVQFYHSSTSKWSKEFLAKLKRHYYVTPTSYIELITTFKKLLDEKRKEVQADIFKYENGYEKIIKTENSVEGMKKNLI
jgi:dynein heavy chain, axonemal